MTVYSANLDLGNNLSESNNGSSGEDGCSIDSCSMDGVVRECYKSVSWTTTTDFCDCAILPGWTGDNCDELSPWLLWTRVFYVCVCILLISLATLLLVDIARITFIKIKYRGNVDVPLSVFITAIGTLLCYLGHLFNAANLAHSAFDPDATVIISENGTGVMVINSNAIASFTFLFLTLGFAGMAQLQITISWLAIVDKVSKLKVFNTGKWLVAVRAYKIFSQIATIVIFILGIAFAVKLNQMALRATAPVFIFTVSILVLIGRIRFINVVNPFDRKDRFKRPLYLVRKASMWVLIFNVAYMIAISADLLVMSYSKFDVQPGSFNLERFLNNISFLAAYCSFMTYHWYVHHIINGFYERTSHEDAKTWELKKINRVASLTSTRNHRQPNDDLLEASL